MQFAALVSGIAAAVAGQDVNVASAAGGNAAANNYLNHDQAARLGTLLNRCKVDCTVADRAELQALIDRDVATTRALNDCGASRSAQCVAVRADYDAARNSYLPNTAEVDAWAQVKALQSGGRFTAAQIAGAYQASMLGMAPSRTTSGDLNEAADWVRAQMQTEPTLSRIAMGAAVYSNAQLSAALGLGVLSNDIAGARARAGLAVGDEGATGGPIGTATGGPIGTATATTAVSDAALPEANFAGGVPVRPRDGAVASGTAVTETPLGRHLIEAQVVGSGPKATISGGHNMSNFDAAIQQAGGTVTSRIEVAPGIYEVRYQLPGGKDQPKTVYDPARYSDVQMANMASEAAARGIVQYRVTGNPRQLVEVNGVTFLVTIRVPGSNYSATQAAQPYVPTAYPVNPREVNP